MYELGWRSSKHLPPNETSHAPMLLCSSARSASLARAAVWRRWKMRPSFVVTLVT